ncbi:hypothetical protein J1N35_002842 [Gossypium stocksii]|uniref:Uncharacterized protein n=1 Tax=Gossypium stocksii TaxID=47602 RepID=A0A9D4AP28_9ROSI|nr:hypothetical protein J1N35_002842 [Gossypium stocksii]
MGVCHDRVSHMGKDMTVCLSHATLYLQVRTTWTEGMGMCPDRVNHTGKDTAVCSGRVAV